MSSLKHHIPRLLLAFFLAIIIVPIGNLLSPETLFSERASVSDSVTNAVEEHLAAEAKKYGIEQPGFRFSNMRFAAVTTHSEDPADRGKVVIVMGKPVQRAAILEFPDRLKAIAGHEFGHALMMARDQSLNKLPIFVMYAAGLLPLLLAFPSNKSRIGVSLTIAGVLGIFLTIYPDATINEAYLTMMCIMLTSSIALYWLLIGHTDGAIARRFAPHLPTRRGYLVSSFIGATLFGLAFVMVGGSNNIYELRADAIGACSTSATSMKEALLNLSDNPIPHQKNLTDTFHPDMSVRINMLTEMENRQIYESACSAILDGQTPLQIQGHQLQ